jgi:hypothetical protein
MCGFASQNDLRMAKEKAKRKQAILVRGGARGRLRGGGLLVICRSVSTVQPPIQCVLCYWRSTMATFPEPRPCVLVQLLWFMPESGLQTKCMSWCMHIRLEPVASARPSSASPPQRQKPAWVHAHQTLTPSPKRMDGGGHDEWVHPPPAHGCRSPRAGATGGGARCARRVAGSRRPGYAGGRRCV